jgi:hypothetical protein
MLHALVLALEDLGVLPEKLRVDLWPAYCSWTPVASLESSTVYESKIYPSVRRSCVWLEGLHIQVLDAIKNFERVSAGNAA